MNDDPTSLASLVLIAIGVLSLISIGLCLIQGRMVSAIGGLHLNVLFMLSIGPLGYVYFEPPPERQPYHETVTYFWSVGVWFLGGYAIWLVIEWLVISRLYRDVSKELIDLKRFPNQILIGLAVASLIGYFCVGLEFAASGIGTILVVLKNFMYPVLLVVLLRTDWKKFKGVLLAMSWASTVFTLSVLSPWRSDLIVSGFCLLLYVCIRKPILSLPLVLVGIFSLWMLLPTLQYKKAESEEFKASPLQGIVRSQDIDSTTRVAIFAEFISIRLNYIREMAYVQRGIDSGALISTEGQTYVDSVYQLIPRILWTDKPVFNYTTGFMIPRQIGLLGWEDTGSSWGVNAYGEFLMNFRKEMLIVFIPLLFFAFYNVERFSVRMMKMPGMALLSNSTYFFMTITLVSLVNLGTFVVWGFVTLAIIDRSRIKLNLE